MAKDRVEVDIVADAKGATQGTEKLASSFATAAKRAIGMTAALGGAAIAGAKLVQAAKEAERAFFVQEKSVSLLNASLRSTGQYSDSTSRDLRDFASEMQRVTTVGDEAAMQLEQYAISAGLSADAAKQATQDAIGLSKAFGIELTAAIKATVNAQQGNYDMLNRYLPAVKNATDETDRASIAQRQLAAAFEVAMEEARTASGTNDQLNNVLGDTKELMGQVVSEGLTPLRRALIDYVSTMNEAIEQNLKFKEAMDLVYGRDDGSDMGLQKKVEALKYGYEELEKRAQTLRDTIAKNENGTEQWQRATAARAREALENITLEQEALQERISLLSRAAEQEAVQARAQAAMNEQAAAAAEAEKKAAEQAAKDMEILQDAYARTHEGQIAALETQIALFESYKDGPMAQAVLADLYEELETLRGKTEEVTEAVIEQAGSYTMLADYSSQAGNEIAQAHKNSADSIEDEAEKINELNEALWTNTPTDWATLAAEAWSAADEAFFYSHDRKMEAFERENEQLTDQEKLVRNLAHAVQNSFANAYVDAFSAVGEALVEGENAFGAFAKAVLLGFADMLQSLSAQLAAYAVIGLFTTGGTLSPAALAGSALAAAAAGATRAAANNFKAGGEFQVPEGYRNDDYMVGLSSGEKFTVQNEDQAAVSGDMYAPLNINIDGTPIYRGLLKASKNGIALLDARAVVKR